MLLKLCGFPTHIVCKEVRMRYKGLCAQATVVHWHAAAGEWMSSAILDMTTRWQNFTHCAWRLYLANFTLTFIFLYKDQFQKLIERRFWQVRSDNCTCWWKAWCSLQWWGPWTWAWAPAWTASKSSRCGRQSCRRCWCCRTWRAWCWTCAGSCQLCLETG